MKHDRSDQKNFTFQLIKQEICSVSDKIDNMFVKMVSYESKVNHMSHKLDNLKVDDFKKTIGSDEDL